MSVQAAQGGADVAELAAAEGEPPGQHPLYVEVVLVGAIRVLSRRRDEALPSSYGGAEGQGGLTAERSWRDQVLRGALSSAVREAAR
jgi:hypothetical protein